MFVCLIACHGNMIFHYYSVGGTNNRQQKEFWEGGGGTQIDVSSFHLFLVGYVRIGRGKQRVLLALFLVVFGWNGRLFFLIFLVFWVARACARCTILRKCDYSAWRYIPVT